MGQREKLIINTLSENKYEIINYWSADDDAYIAEVPELPGCSADGSSMMQALENIEIVIGEWIKTAEAMGRAVPKPRGKLQFA